MYLVVAVFSSYFKIVISTSAKLNSKADFLFDCFTKPSQVRTASVFFYYFTCDHHLTLEHYDGSLTHANSEIPFMKTIRKMKVCVVGHPD